MMFGYSFGVLFVCEVLYVLCELGCLMLLGFFVCGIVVLL